MPIGRGKLLIRAIIVIGLSIALLGVNLLWPEENEKVPPAPESIVRNDERPFESEKSDSRLNRAKQEKSIMTVSEVLAVLEDSAQNRILLVFQQAGVEYPPKKLAFLVFKDEKKLEMWAGDTEDWRYIRSYHIQAASGGPGPKLQEGDLQVPEGIYRITDLNPNSAYHLSMRVNYPNEYDRQKARSEGRANLGGDIYLHGKTVSAGCIAVGDAAIEELFTVVAQTGQSQVKLIIAPNDIRTEEPLNRQDISWLSELYTNIKQELSVFNREE